jgi:hypothetical protein
MLEKLLMVHENPLLRYIQNIQKMSKLDKHFIRISKIQFFVLCSSVMLLVLEEVIEVKSGSKKQKCNLV